jgi:hypothetical protein
MEAGVEMGGRLHGKRVDDELLFLCGAHGALQRLIEGIIRECWIGLD